jgi:hypothetical protein
MLMSVDRFLNRAFLIWGALRDELAFALTNPGCREESTVGAYGRYAVFLPGGDCFKEGLFPWEIEAISNPAFPRTGRILVGAVGGGREMQGLAERGYAVTAFEPAEPLARGAKEAAAKLQDCRVFQASFADFVRAAEGGGDEFAATLRSERYDGAILGWSSFTHVIPAQARLDLLRAIRKVCPAGPVLLSYYARFRTAPGRMRRALRWLVRRFGLTPAENGDFLAFNNGFAHVFTRAELEGLIAEAGYEVAAARWYLDPQPYVLIRPVQAPK